MSQYSKKEIISCTLNRFGAQRKRFVSKRVELVVDTFLVGAPRMTDYLLLSFSILEKKKN
jgi:hypothetical protein